MVMLAVRVTVMGMKGNCWVWTGGLVFVDVVLSKKYFSRQAPSLFSKSSNLTSKFGY